MTDALKKVDSGVEGLASSPQKEVKEPKARRASSLATDAKNIADLGIQGSAV